MATIGSAPGVAAPGAAAQATPAAQSPPAGQARTAELVRLPFPQDDGTLTPYTFELGYPLMTLVYDTLLWRDRNGAPQPWLAQAVEPSADGRRIAVRLAPGAKWHDGRPVTSADVAFTFRYIARHPHPRFTAELGDVERVDTPDPATAVISLRRPSPGFADQPLADLPILPAHLWQDLPAGTLAPPGLPVGSGPYRLVDYRPGERYRFEAVADYFRGPPAVRAIEVPFVNTADQTLEALDRRRVDMLPINLPEAAARRVEGLGIRLLKGPSYLGTVLVMNTRRPPFDRVEVRRAVSAAIDLKRIVANGSPAARADRGYLHPDSPWSSPEVLHRTDEAAARATLSTGGLAPIQVLVPDNDPVKLEAGRQVALALTRAGTVAASKIVPRDVLSHALGEDGSSPDFDAAISVAPPLASYDPDFLDRLFGSNPQPGSFNFSGYRSPAFDALADRIATTGDPNARRAAVTDALRLLADDAPVVPLFFLDGSYAYRPAIYDGWVFVKGGGILDKRSFVDRAPPAASVTTAGPGATVGVVETARDRNSSSGGLSPLGLVSLGLLGVAAVLAVVALVRR